jgi:hypothetical protein
MVRVGRKSEPGIPILLYVLRQIPLNPRKAMHLQQVGIRTVGVDYEHEGVPDT